MAAAWLFAEAPWCPVEVFRPAHHCHQRISLVPRAGNLTHGAVSAACTPPHLGDKAMSRVSPGCWSCQCLPHGSRMEMGPRGGGIKGCSVRRSRDLGLAIFMWLPAQSWGPAFCLCGFGASWCTPRPRRRDRSVSGCKQGLWFGDPGVSSRGVLNELSLFFYYIFILFIYLFYYYH